MENQFELYEQLRYLEERLMVPAVRSSAAEMANLLADDFYEVGSSGCTYNKQQAIDALTKLPPIKITIADFKAIPLSTSIALATYLAIHHNDEEPTYSLRSSIWRLHNDRWQIVFHQGTPSMVKDNFAHIK